MKRFQKTCVIACALGACSPAVVVTSGALVAATINDYCNSTSHAGRQAIRDRVSAGRTVLACDDQGEE